MKVLITGGHHNSALVIAEALRSKGYDLVWVGHRHTMVNDPHESLEYQEVTSKHLQFITILAGKFHAQAHPVHWLRLPLGLIQAMRIIWLHKPQLILTFGGYIAVPIALSAKLAGIPVILFEQTTTIGRANQLISKFSQHNFLAWEESRALFPVHNSQVVGLPLRQEIWKPVQKSWFKNKRQIIVVTGGKQGSHAINQAVFPLISTLLTKFNLIHQTGATVKTSDFQTATKLKQNLPPKLQPYYLPQPHFTSEDMLEALKASSLVITRSGAHIVYELLTLHKPAVLIPLPFSYLNEQAQNAAKLATSNPAIIISQKKLNPQTLLQAVNQLSQIKRHPPQTLLPNDATKIITTYIESHYPHASQLSPKTT